MPNAVKKSNRQNYKCRAVYLKTSNLRNLVYHCNVCAKKIFLEVYFIERAESQLLRDAAE